MKRGAQLVCSLELLPQTDVEEVLRSNQQLPSAICLNADGTYEVSDLAIWQFLKDTTGGKCCQECTVYVRAAISMLLCQDVLDICATIVQEQPLS